MKKRKLLHGFALAALMTLGIAGVAHADTCANAQTTYTGNTTIGSAGTACTISHPVTATGSLTVLGTTVSTQALTSQGISDLIVNATGNTSTGAISAD